MLLENSKEESGDDGSAQDAGSNWDHPNADLSVVTLEDSSGLNRNEDDCQDVSFTQSLVMVVQRSNSPSAM
jgi:hypothetical protein